jgi:hypothetical protein
LAVSIGLAGRATLVRRPLGLEAQPRRNVPWPLFLSLLSPLVPPLLLLHAEPGLLPSPILFLALCGAAIAAMLLDERRRLAAELRWAAVAVGVPPDGTVVVAEIEPKRLVVPPGQRERTPWFLADLGGTIDGKPARIALERAIVDREAIRVLRRLALGHTDPGARLTVVGPVSRAPADAEGADPLCRDAAVQLRFIAPLVAGHTPDGLQACLRAESLELAISLGFALGAALFAL